MSIGKIETFVAAHIGVSEGDKDRIAHRGAEALAKKISGNETWATDGGRTRWVAKIGLTQFETAALDASPTARQEIFAKMKDDLAHLLPGQPIADVQAFYGKGLDAGQLWMKAEDKTRWG